MQNPEYISNVDSIGCTEYWKYPMETLWDGEKDCEDSTILCNTLLMMAGYDVTFLFFTDYAITTVIIDVEGYYVEMDGVRYVFCETTDVWKMT